MSNPYNDKFYQNHLKKQEILKVYATKLYQMYKPESVIDVGCGPAYAISKFQEMGCQVKGLEYSIDAARRAAPEPVKPLLEECDVTSWLQIWSFKKYDLALSWHMAEHVPEVHSDKIVEGLSRLSNLIHFSAAPPGQAGVGHVNCKKPEWWAEKFADKGYTVDETATKEWWEAMNSKYGTLRYGQGIRDNAIILVR